MKPTQANITVETENIWHVDGQLTFSTVRSLLNKSKKLFSFRSLTAESSKNTLEIDLSQVTRSDSSALALLTEWQRMAIQHKKIITFKNISQQLHNIAKLSKLDNILNIV